jgi:hypothetical protein
MTETTICHPAEPLWLEQLRGACATTTQAEVARRLALSGDGKYPSPAVINQALGGRYEGNLARLQALVEGVLMTVSVDCPVIGDLPRQRCLEHQSRRGAFAVTNPSRIQLYKVCPTCVHRLEKSA